jgi:hypothetical protein
MLIAAHGHEAAAGTGLLHALTFVIWLPGLVIWRLLERRRGSAGWAAAAVAAWTSYAAGVIHLAVTPEHFGESALYGWFFLVVFAGQVGFAVLAAWRTDARLFVLAAAGQLALTGLWLLTRTSGIPLGPEAGEVEAVGVLDLACVVAQLVCTAACLQAYALARAKTRRTYQSAWL